MSAIHPFAFFLLALAVPVVVGYLHRRRRRTERVSSSVLFRVLVGPSAPTKRALARVRHRLSLTLVLASLVVFALALADLRPQADQPRDWVVVLDGSTSMGATLPGASKSRLDDARDALNGALAGLGPSDRVALLISGRETQVTSNLTSNLDHIRAAAAAVVPEGSSAAMAETLVVADAMAQAGRDGRLVLISDGVGVRVPELRTPIEYVAVGTAGPNVGINALAVREADALGLTEVFVAVTSDLGRPEEIELSLRVDDTLVDVLPIEVPAHGRVERLHRVELPEGTEVRASLERNGADLLGADDTATTSRRVGERMRVLLVATSRRSFAAEALRLHPRVDLRVVGPNDAVPAGSFDLLVLETDYRAGTLPEVRRVLAFGTDPGALGLHHGSTVVAPEILRWSYDDPLFRFVDLENLKLPRATTIAPAEDLVSLVDSEAGPLGVRQHTPNRDVVYFGFSAHHSDLVLRVAFVNLMANAVEWSARAEDPDALSDRWSATGAASIPTTTHAVLPESETRLDPVLELLSARTTRFPAQAPARAPWWRYFAIAGLIALIIEGGLGPLQALVRRQPRGAKPVRRPARAPRKGA